MIEGLRQLAKYAKDFITKYSAELIAGSVLLAASGTVATLEANDKNKKAIELANDAIDKYQRTKEETQDSLIRLGEFKMKVYASFDDFCKEIEKIKNPPNSLKKEISEIDLPDISSQLPPKKLNANMQTAVAGGAGMVGGTVIGVAFFGIQGLALVPGAAVGGFFVCVKGFSLLKKSVENLEDAKILCQGIEREITYLNDLQTCSNKLMDSTKSVHKMYKTHIECIQSFLSPNTDWETLLPDQQLIIQNTAMLTGFLKSMCDAEVLSKDNNNNNQVNSNGIIEIAVEAENKVKNIESAEKECMNQMRENARRTVNQNVKLSSSTKNIKLKDQNAGFSSETKKLKLGRANNDSIEISDNSNIKDNTKRTSKQKFKLSSETKKLKIGRVQKNPPASSENPE